MTIALFLVLSALAGFLQGLLPWTWFPGDLPLLAIFAGLRRGRGLGLFSGALAGLMLDTLSSPQAGLRIAPLALVGAIADSLESGVNREQPRLQILVVAGLCIVHDLALVLLARRWGLNQGGTWRVLGSFVVPRLLTQALLAVPVFAALGLILRQRVFQDPFRRPVRSIQRW